MLLDCLSLQLRHCFTVRQFRLHSSQIYFIFLRFYLFIFRERGREGERKGEKHQCVVASHAPRTGDLTHNPGMCLDWESNWRPFGLQAHAQSTELHQPGRHRYTLISRYEFYKCWKYDFSFFEISWRSRTTLLCLLSPLICNLQRNLQPRSCHSRLGRPS